MGEAGQEGGAGARGEEREDQERAGAQRESLDLQRDCESGGGPDGDDRGGGDRPEDPLGLVHGRQVAHHADDGDAGGEGAERGDQERGPGEQGRVEHRLPAAKLHGGERGGADRGGGEEGDRGGVGPVLAPEGEAGHEGGHAEAEGDGPGDVGAAGVLGARLGECGAGGQGQADRGRGEEPVGAVPAEDGFQERGEDGAGAHAEAHHGAVRGGGPAALLRIGEDRAHDAEAGGEQGGAGGALDDAGGDEHGRGRGEGREEGGGGEDPGADREDAAAAVVVGEAARGEQRDGEAEGDRVDDPGLAGGARVQVGGGLRGEDERRGVVEDDQQRGGAEDRQDRAGPGRRRGCGEGGGGHAGAPRFVQ
ncbi:hypothetical protein GCM10009853_028720 [Glycomyces scopariae]